MQSFPENWKGGSTSLFILCSCYYLDTNTKQRQYKRMELQTNIPHQCKHEIFNKYIINKENLVIYKKNYTA